MVQTNGTTQSYTMETAIYCPHLLPCGYCTLLFRDCPKQNGAHIDWWNTQPTVGDDPTFMRGVQCNE